VCGREVDGLSATCLAHSLELGLINEAVEHTALACVDQIPNLFDILLHNCPVQNPAKARPLIPGELVVTSGVHAPTGVLLQ